MVAQEPNPTVARRELAIALRRAREQHRRSFEDLAAFLGVTAPQASRLDSGMRGFRPDDVRKLVEWYGLGHHEGERLVALAQEARKRAWWQQIDLPDAYRTLIGHEQVAESILEYGATIVPGLLQTPDYARAIVMNGPMPVSAGEVDRAIAVRMRRQAILTGPHPPNLRFVIDEVALARGPRDPQVKRAQLEHLLAVAAGPYVTVQVIAFEYGLHPGDRLHFIMLVRSGVPDLVYSDGLLRPVLIEETKEIARYSALWDELQGIALDPYASLDRIRHYLVS
jgi:transcriptional regulator with XRE-family HTH domain